jgi:predicted RNase H-like nuclease (RuvC/YqgF family)
MFRRFYQVQEELEDISELRKRIEEQDRFIAHLERRLEEDVSISHSLSTEDVFNPISCCGYFRKSCRLERYVDCS